MVVFSFSLFSKLNCNIVKIYKRNLCDKTVRVRFAPSPTGLLHLGGLRTALFNHLFAKKQNGVTILRIEDTDQTRMVKSASENLINDLAWCGIQFDEGPYYQSKRLKLYQEYADKLLQEKKAYYCFCSKLRLELIRKEALRLCESPKYDNKCRYLTDEEIETKLRDGEVPCIRFKLSEIGGPINDLICEPINYEVSQNEGDPVILKADGFPTYHFANVIDDHLMNISHVLRGVEWQISTAKHLLLYRAFNWEPPVYGHIPLLLNTDGSKLSKRQGDVHIQGLREKGYFPNAILNFIVRYGGGFNIEQCEKDKRIFKLDELLDRFDILRLKSYSSKININSLNDYNGLEIKRMLDENNNSFELIERVKEILLNYCKQSGEQRKLNLDPAYLTIILEKLKSRITRLEDLTSTNFLCFWFWNNDVTIEDPKIVNAIEKYLMEIKKMEWTVENLKNFGKDFAKEHNLEFPKLMKSLRKVLVGYQDGPGIAEIQEILGKENVCQRLAETIENSRKSMPS